MHGHKACGKIFALAILAVGILFLLQDLKVWNFWGVSWYTIFFLLIGIKFMMHHHDECCEEKKK
jgi:hypothetical protein